MDKELGELENGDELGEQKSENKYLCMICISYFIRFYQTIRLLTSIDFFFKCDFISHKGNIWFLFWKTNKTNN